MEKEVPTVPAGMRLTELSDLIAQGDAKLSAASRHLDRE